MFAFFETPKLKKRWEGQEPRIDAILSDIKANRDWTHNLLASEKWGQLPLLESCPCQYSNQNTTPRDLRGISLFNIDFTAVEGLTETYFDYGNFVHVVFESSSLRGSSFVKATFHSDCIFDSAKLEFANCSGTEFSNISFVNVDFTNANLKGANLENAILIGAKLNKVEINREPFWGFLVPRRNQFWTRFGGEYQYTNDLDPSINPPIFHYIKGEDLRWLLNQQNSFISKLWYISANYGRSPARLFFWLIFIWLFFGMIYAQYPLPAFLVGSLLGRILCWLSPGITWQNPTIYWFDFRPFYASTATITSVAFSEQLLEPFGWKAQVYICVETVLGYIILGVFISILVHAINQFQTDGDYQRTQDKINASLESLRTAIENRYLGGANNSWPATWRELQKRLQNLPLCTIHSNYHCINTLSYNVVNDIVAVNERGIIIRSHRTMKERFITTKQFEELWNWFRTQDQKTKIGSRNAPSDADYHIKLAILLSCLSKEHEIM
jgi:hypothetical protein